MTPISGPGSLVGMVAMEASPNAVHFEWSTDTTTRYRRLLRIGTGWRLEPIRSTRAVGGAYDNGSDLAVRGPLCQDESDSSYPWNYCRGRDRIVTPWTRR